jgi:hypothetical protein
LADKTILQTWVLEALRQLGGSGTVLQVSQIVWSRHEQDLRDSGALFYTWQYDLRWAAQNLRTSGSLKPTMRGAGSLWELARP